MKLKKSLCSSCRHLVAGQVPNVFACTLGKPLITPTMPNLCHDHQRVKPAKTEEEITQLGLFNRVSS